MLLGNAHLTQSTRRWKDGQVPFCGGNVIWEQGEILRSKYYLGYGSKYRIVQEGYLYKEKWNKGQGTTLCENDLSIIVKKIVSKWKKCFAAQGTISLCRRSFWRLSECPKRLLCIQYSHLLYWDVNQWSMEIKRALLRGKIKLSLPSA